MIENITALWQNNVSFAGRPPAEAGPLHFGAAQPAPDDEFTFTPRGIETELKRYVVDQDSAIKRMALAVYRHARTVLGDRFSDIGAKEAHQPNRAVTPEMAARRLEEYFEPGDDARRYGALLNLLSEQLSTHSLPLGQLQTDTLAELFKDAVDQGIIRLSPDFEDQFRSDHGSAIAGYSQDEQVELALSTILFHLTGDAEEAASRAGEAEQPAEPALPPEQAGARMMMEELLAAANDDDRYRNRFSLDEAADEAGVKKSNVLMIGPTGSGKTYTFDQIQALFKRLGIDVPVVKFDVSNLTEAGYVGSSIEDIARGLYYAAGKDLGKAQKGIVFLDEIDKLRKTEGNGRDVSGDGAQKVLLGLLGGNPITFEPSKQENAITLDTGNVWFVTGGAFEGLTEIIRERVEGGQKDTKPKIGFNTDLTIKPVALSDGELLQRVTKDDLVRYGFKHELVGRLPVVASINPLDEHGLRDILTEPRGAVIKRYQNTFRNDYGAGLEFTEEALQKIAKRAKASGTGARALDEQVFLATEEAHRVAPEYPAGTRFVITEDTVDDPARFDVEEPAVEGQKHTAASA